MNKKISNSNLVINSNRELIFFQLGNHGEVKYNLYDSTYKFVDSLKLHEKNILRYSVAIDNIDKIHLIALMNSGELIYSTYEKDNWSNGIIAKFDSRSNLYNHINVSIVENKINIIYNYANLINSNVWTLQHVIDDKQNWEKHNIIRYVSDKISTPFCVDTDSFSTIHLLYRTVERDNSQVYHTFYNSFVEKWNQTPQRLSFQKTNNLYPYLFVDTKDTLHSLWLEMIDVDCVLRYCRLTSKGHERYIWNQTKIPYISNCINTPIIFEEKSILKIVYLTSNSIGYLYSLDYGNSWNQGDINEINPSTVNFTKISSNISNTNVGKVNHVYYSIEEDLKFYFVDNLNLINRTSTKVNSHNVQLKKSTDKVQISEIDNVNIIEILEPKIDQLLLNQDEIKSILYDNLDTQKRIEEKIENLSKLLNTKKSSFFGKLFDSSK